MPGEGLAAGLSVGEGLGVASGDGEGAGVGEGVGDPFFFLPDFDDGDGELFGVGVTEASGLAAGEAVAFGVLVAVGVGLGFGVALAFGAGEVFGFGEGVGVEDFFFAELELFRFFGAGVGSKMLLILSPNDCASARGVAMLPRIAIARASRTTLIAVIPSLRRGRGTTSPVRHGADSPRRASG